MIKIVLFEFAPYTNVLISISKVFSHFGDFESSLNSLLKALKIESNSNLLYEISLVLYKINKIEKSLNYALESLMLDRFNLSSLCFTIELLAKLDKKEISYELMPAIHLYKIHINLY